MNNEINNQKGSASCSPPPIEATDDTTEVRSSAPEDNLSFHSEIINLKKMYPMEHRSILLRSAPIGIGVLGIDLIALGTGIFVYRAQTPLISIHTHQLLTFYIFWAGLLALFIRLGYEETYHVFYYYGIEADHFVVSNGVFLKNRSSFHVSAITDIYLERTCKELVLLLYTLHVVNLASPKEAPNVIHGLGRRNAIGLQDYLMNYVQKAKPIAETIHHSSAPAEKEETDLHGAPHHTGTLRA